MALQSSIPLFGRAWSIQITNQAGFVTSFTSSAWDPETLRCTFEISTHCFHPCWTAQVKIWNLSKATSEAAAGVNSTGIPFGAMGDGIVISAGYQAGFQAGTPTVIFKGRIYQTLIERDDGVDTVTTWMASTGTMEFYRNYTFVSYIGGTSNAQIVENMIQNSLHPDYQIRISAEDQETLGQIKPIRGGAFSGSLAEGLNGVAAHMSGVDQTPWAAWFDGQYHNLGSVRNQKSAPDLIYSPIPAPGQNITLDPSISYTLIGSPQQTQTGVEFRVLLDPRLIATTPQMLVKLDNTIIRQLEVLMNSQGGVSAPPYALNQDSQYLVIGVTHLGDTRGNEWWSVVTGASTQLNAIQQLSGGG